MPFKNRDQEEAWAAGIFEGEGTVGAWGKHYWTRDGVKRTRKTVRVTLTVCMTDDDVIYRWATIMNSKVYGPYFDGGGKAKWRAVLDGEVHVRRAYEMFKPFLGERRLEQIETALGVIQNPVQE